MRLIDADALIKAIDEKARQCKCEDTINGLCGAVALIFDAPTIQEPCEDAISRKRVMAEYCMREGVSKKSFVDIINDLPPVNPQPKTGHWLYSGENGRDKWTCDNCFDFVRKPQKTCPNCGARMESEEMK